MLRRLTGVAAVLVVGAAAALGSAPVAPAPAASAAPAAAPLVVPDLPRPPDVPLAAYVVLDDVDGAVLAAKKPREHRAVASITKQMTALLALRSLKLDQTATVPAQATTIGESTVGLVAGREETVRTLMDALMVPSANDAAETLAFAVSGAERPFVQRMNATARQLGLRDTAYRAPYGLDAPGQYSSALDQVRLARILMRDPRLRGIVRQRSIQVDGRTYPARNTLLGVYPGVDGVKTGHTSDAGWCIVVSATQDGHRLYVAALGASDEATRNAAVARLLDWGFARYQRVRLVRRGDRFATLPVDYGGGAVDVVAGADLTRELRDGQAVEERITLPDRVAGGLHKGDAVGQVEVLVGGKPAGTVRLVVARDVPAASRLDEARWVVGRALDTLIHPGSWLP